MSLGFAPLGSTPLSSLPAAAGGAGAVFAALFAVATQGATLTAPGAAGALGPAPEYAQSSSLASLSTGIPLLAAQKAIATELATFGSPTIIVKIAPFFTTDTITTAGYQLYHYVGVTSTADGAHHTTGIDAIPSVTNGYQVPLTADLLTLDADGGYRGSIVWDSGGGSPFYVPDEVYVPPNKSIGVDMTQAVPTSNTAHTVGDALNAARAQGFGKWVISGTTLTLYASDGTTAVRVFTLDSSSVPTQRV